MTPTDSAQGLASRVDRLEEEVVIAVVGKYTGLTDSYLSVIKVRFAGNVSCVCASC